MALELLLEEEETGGQEEVAETGQEVVVKCLCEIESGSTVIGQDRGKS